MDFTSGMALVVRGEASSSNFSNHSKSVPAWKFHVFLSFTGQDTRRNFTDHLYHALWESGITAFRDDEELQRGEVISKQLLQAIEDSLFSIVVLSKNYACSSWCLDELKEILEARKNLGRYVFPVFYEVDPSDVRHQKGSFGEALAKHEERFKDSKDKVQQWRLALTEVANLSGWDSKGWHEKSLIENIVGVIWTKLRPKFPSYKDDLVGIDSRIGQLSSLLGLGFDDVRFIGIWGMGGIGKTTLARFVYEKISGEFKICCFLSNVRETSSEKDGLLHLQTQFLSHLKIHSMLIRDKYEGKMLIRNLFYRMKVLLVLDDVSDRSQLENLAENREWFGAGSRVLITTRDLHLLKSHGVDPIYNAQSMNEDESLQLLSKKAFKRDHPEDDYLELSKSVVQYAGGLPLALEVLGSFLCERSKPEWEDVVNKLSQIPIDDDSILPTLKISYDGLDNNEKMIFLDVACFFKGGVKEYVTQVLKNCDLHATIGLSRLIEKCLITERANEHHEICIEMHDLLQELGKSIVLQESSNNVGRRSRLWSLEDINEVLKNNIGTEAIQGMVLQLQKEKQKEEQKEEKKNEKFEVHWDPEAFSKMCNLRLLIVSSELSLPHGFQCLSRALKVLHWSKYPLKALPLETSTDKLVDIKLQQSKLKQLWSGIQCFGKLKFIDLSHSEYLERTPNFVGVPNLERLILEGCTSLVEVHPSTGDLKMLVEVNLKGCKSLKFFPRKLEMNSLTKLVLCGCSKLKNVPEFGEDMKNLLLLDLQDTAITELPESLGFLTNLEHLDLKGCKYLVSLPCTFHNLKCLKYLNLSGCSKFCKLPENLNENEALQKLDVSDTSIKEAPSSMVQLRNLTTLSFYGCKGSTSNSWSLYDMMFGRSRNATGLVLPPLSSLTSLTQLNLGNCGISDGSIFNEIGSLSLLRKLDLRGNNFDSLPADCISRLLGLQALDVGGCSKLKSLPNLPPRMVRLNAGDCGSMEALSDEQLWHFFSSLDSQSISISDASDVIDLHARLKKNVKKEKQPVMIPYASLDSSDFIAFMPGSEIPSWFWNREDCIPSSSSSKTLQVSITTKVPECCIGSEWSRICICLVIDVFGYTSEDYPISLEYTVSWVSAKSKRFRGHTIYAEGNYAHLCLMYVDYSKETSASTDSNNQIEIEIATVGFVVRGFVPVDQIMSAEIKKIGWRFLCQHDIQEWRNGNEFHEFSSAEDDTTHVKAIVAQYNPNKKRKRHE